MQFLLLRCSTSYPWLLYFFSQPPLSRYYITSHSCNTQTLFSTLSPPLITVPSLSTSLIHYRPPSLTLPLSLFLSLLLSSSSFHHSITLIYCSPIGLHMCASPSLSSHSESWQKKSDSNRRYRRLYSYPIFFFYRLFPFSTYFQLILILIFIIWKILLLKLPFLNILISLTFIVSFKDTSCFTRLLEMNVLAPRLGDSRLLEE